MQPTFKLKLINALRYALVLQRLVFLIVQTLEAFFETKGTLFQLTELLIAHSHVAEELKYYVLISQTLLCVDTV